MTEIRLPDNKKTELIARTRLEFGITDDDERRVRRVNVISGSISFAVAIAVGLTIRNQWDSFAAFLFLITFIGPIVVILGTFALLQPLLTRWLVPGWSAYELAKLKRLRVATEQYKQKVMQADAFWQNLDGHAFEREFARLLKRHGYRTEVTRSSGDGGIDIIADDGKGLIAVQCKRNKKPVGPGVIRELFGAVTAGKYRMGMLAVTGGVTKGVHEFIKGKPLQIVDLPQIVRLQMELNNKGQED